jgi:DNA-binding MarR family transcriptional regulator
MARPSAIVTETELSVLNHLWEYGPSVVREIAFAIYTENTPAYHATMNSLLDRMEQKGYPEPDQVHGPEPDSRLRAKTGHRHYG